MSSPSPETTSYNDQTPELSRAASYTDLPSQTATESSLRRTFSDYAVPTLAESPTKESVAAGKDILRRTSLRSKDKPKPTVSRFTLSSSEDLKDTEHVPETRAPEPAARPSKSRSMSGRIVSLARKPWGSSSRSPSPSAKRSKQDSQTAAQSNGRKSEDDPSQPSRKRTILYKRPRRPMVAVVAKGPEDSPISPSSPSGHSLRHRTSFEKFTASLSVSTPVLPPMPKGAAETAAAYANSGLDPSRKKDELWGIFRGLEADFQK